MSEASLSQEEIDALLMGSDEDDAADFGGGSVAMMDSEPAGGDGELSAFQSMFSEAMSNASNSASSLIGKSLTITGLQLSEVDADDAASEVLPGSVIVEINMGNYTSAIVFDEEIARNISMTMMGAEEEPVVMDEAYLSTIGELSNTLLSSISNNLSGKIGENISPGPPETRVFQTIADMPSFPSGRALRMSYHLDTGDGVEGNLVQYIDSSCLQRWNTQGAPAPAAPRPSRPQQPQQQQQQPARQPMEQMGGGMDFYGGNQPAGGDYSMGSMGSMNAQGGGGISINPVNFPSLTGGGQQGQMPSNIDLLLDVQMIMTVELGRTRKYVKDILGLGEGSIIELDKLAGEPVDLLVNGKLIAKGEVVVIDENFGVRVTDIVGPAERLARLTGD